MNKCCDWIFSTQLGNVLVAIMAGIVISTIYYYGGIMKLIKEVHKSTSNKMKFADEMLGEVHSIILKLDDSQEYRIVEACGDEGGILVCVGKLNCLSIRPVAENVVRVVNVR